MAAETIEARRARIDRMTLKELRRATADLLARIDEQDEDAPENDSPTLTLIRGGKA
jgi:hypothetical protein